jgi:hypothetical protein
MAKVSGHTPSTLPSVLYGFVELPAQPDALFSTC